MRGCAGGGLDAGNVGASPKLAWIAWVANMTHQLRAPPAHTINTLYIPTPMLFLAPGADPSAQTGGTRMHPARH